MSPFNLTGGLALCLIIKGILHFPFGGYIFILSRCSAFFWGLRKPPLPLHRRTFEAMQCRRFCMAFLLREKIF